MRFRINTKWPQTLSALHGHLQRVEELVEVRATIEGDVIEYGCYEGGGTVNLRPFSWLTNRRVVVGDSQVLPSPDENDPVATPATPIIATPMTRVALPHRSNSCARGAR